MKRRIVTLAVGTAMILAGCGTEQATTTVAIPQEEEAAYAVNTYVTSATNLDEYLEFGGDVTAASSVDVMPDTSGKLVNVRVQVGDTVTRNQLLAEVDPSRPGMTYETSPVRAPVAGTVTSFPMSTGSMVSPTMSIGKISSTSDLEVTISVAERFVSRIKKGQQALLSFDSYPGQVFTAKVTEVNPVLDTTSRSMSVKLQLDPPDDRIKIGMYSRVKLITDSRVEAIAIPRSALVTRADQTYVFVVNSGSNTVTAQPVTVGITVDDLVEVISGLTVGTEVVVSGQTLLDNGSRVNIISRTGGQ